MAFYALLKTYSQHLIKNDQQRIKLMFDLDEIIFNMELLGKKTLNFLNILRAFHKELFIRKCWVDLFRS